MSRREHPLRLLASIGRLHIVAIAAMGTFTFGWLFTGVYPWLLAGICALDWFLVNLLNRVVDLKEDHANSIVGAAFAGRHRRGIVVVGFGLLLGSLLLVHLLRPELTLLRIAYHLLGLAYNWPLLPGGRRLKQLYFWKNSASAAGFILTVFCYPLARTATAWLDGAPTTLPPGIGGATIALSALFFVLFELSYEVIYDLRDAEGDRLARLKTYPVVHGRDAAARIVDVLLGASMVPLIAGYAFGVVPWRIAIMVFAPVLQFVVYRRALHRGITARDCVALTWIGAGMLVTYHLWIVAGLPGSEIGA